MFICGFFINPLRAEALAQNIDVPAGLKSVRPNTHIEVPMPAYVIVDVTVNDPEGYADYKKLSTVAVAQYGGTFLARGRKTETLEGEWQPGRLVILQFSSVEQAKAWLNSPEYAPAKALRHKYAESKMVVIEGVE